MELSEKLKNIRLLVLEVDGVLTDGRTWQDPEGQWRRLFSVRDGLAIRSLNKAGIEVAILTSAQSIEIRQQAKALKLKYFQDDCDQKIEALNLFCRAVGCGLENVAFLSAENEDQGLLQQVGVALTVPTAAAELKRNAHYVTHATGGDGAVREVCQKILATQGLHRADGKRIVNM